MLDYIDLIYLSRYICGLCIHLSRYNHLCVRIVYNNILHMIKRDRYR